MKVHELTPIERTMTVEQLIRKFKGEERKEYVQAAIEFPVDETNEPRC